MPRKLILSGNVQGVNCRYLCSRYAKHFGLRGSASNLRDGTVEVLLASEDDALVERYSKALRENPLDVHFYGHISGIRVYEFNGPLSGDYNF